MNKILTTLVLVAIMIIASCTDLDDIYSEIDFLKKENKEKTDKLNDLEARLRALENLVRTANDEITTIRGLIEVVDKKVSVVSYKELDDKSGYELTMSNNSKIVLKHGAKGDRGNGGDKGEKGDKGDKGDARLMNVKLNTDGLLYWTLNGVFMRDSDGNMIPAQGKDGRDGLTPQMRVNVLNQWKLSLDNGKTWQLVKDANGNPVPAQGPKGEQDESGNDGDTNLIITEIGTTVIIVYNGITYTLQNGGGAPPPRHYMPLTTSRSVNGKIDLNINAANPDQPDGWIDLNNNGIKEDGEVVATFNSFVQYTLGSQTITVYGKVTFLNCAGEQLTALDVSHNTALRNLHCFLNKISGDNMTALVNSLPMRTAGDDGSFRVIAPGNPDEYNVCNATQVGIATDRNWKVTDSDGNPYLGG